MALSNAKHPQTTTQISWPACFLLSHLGVCNNDWHCGNCQYPGCSKKILFPSEYSNTSPKDSPQQTNTLDVQKDSPNKESPFAVPEGFFQQGKSLGCSRRIPHNTLGVPDGFFPTNKHLVFLEGFFLTITFSFPLLVGIILEHPGWSFVGRILLEQQRDFPCLENPSGTSKGLSLLGESFWNIQGARLLRESFWNI